MPTRDVYSQICKGYEDPFARLSAAVIFSAVHDFRRGNFGTRKEECAYFQSFEFEGHAILCGLDPVLFRERLGVAEPKEREPVERWESQLKWSIR